MSAANPGTAGDAVAVSELTVRFAEVVALAEVDLRLGRGTVCALLGANGSGKSTLFKALMDLARPSAGTVTVLGEPPAAARRRAAVGYMPQEDAIDRDFPILVRDVVLTGRYAGMGLRRRARPADREAVRDALARVDLTDLADRQIGRLSGGQRKRAFLARAIAQDAEVLLLDEPFAGVDRTTRDAMTTVLQELRDGGRTVLISTHDIGGVPAWCDRAVLLAGTVLADGPPDEVLTSRTLARTFGLRDVPVAGE